MHSKFPGPNMSSKFTEFIDSLLWRHYLLVSPRSVCVSLCVSETGSRRDFWLIAIYIRSVTAAMTYDVPFLRHVTSDETYNFCIFSKFGNAIQIYLKIGTHIDCTYNMYLAKTCINTSNVLYMFPWQRNIPL